MCTVTWRSEGSELELFDNRDERRSRAPAAPPRIHRHEAVSFLAPLDGDFGGTWISVNDRGLVLCLLNRYRQEGETEREDYVSRGRLVRELAVEETPQSIEAKLGSKKLEVYRPFNLLVARPGEPPKTWTWSGGKLLHEQAEMPLVSSPRAGVVLSSRRRVLEQMRAEKHKTDTELYLAFHRSHEPFKGPTSVCMHHPLATTVSFTRIRVDADRVVMEYQSGSPCQQSPSLRVGIPRC